jgi:hypothetical protein
MNIVWIPFDFTKLTTEQQDDAFVAWCALVMAHLSNYSAKGVLQFEDKGEVGMATEKVIQKADVWIEVDGVKLKTNVMIAFNDMLENDHPRQGSDVRRNDPSWFAGSLVERAKEWEANPPSEGYGILARPTAPDITV